MLVELLLALHGVEVPDAEDVVRASGNEGGLCNQMEFVGPVVAALQLADNCYLFVVEFIQWDDVVLVVASANYGVLVEAYRGPVLPSRFVFFHLQIVG